MAKVQRVVADVDLIYSPDDAGWYFQQYLPGDDSKVSTRTYPTREAAMWEWDAGTVEWA